MAVTVARDPGAACPRLQSRLWALRRNPTGWLIDGCSVTLRRLGNNDWTRSLGWPGCRVDRGEIDGGGRRLGGGGSLRERGGARGVAKQVGLAASTVRSIDLRYLEGRAAEIGWGNWA